MAVSLLIGLAARLSGIIADETRLFQQFPTEDGYFMLAIARNLAIGKGFSVAGGAMPTNGTQPLTTLIWSIPFWLADGHRALGVRLTLILELLGSGVAALLVYRLAKKVLAPLSDAQPIAAVAAAIWFMSPIAVRHSMNTLETGYNAMIALAVANVFIEAGGPSEKPWSIARCIPAGVLLGAAFWMRNDSVFLILAACLTYVVAGSYFGWPAMQTRFTRALVFGATSIVTASPWLAYNYFEFGHIMPVSGRAESLTRHAGGNLTDLPPVVAEYLFGLVPIPEVIELHPAAIWATGILVLAVIVFVVPRLFRSASRAARMLIVFVGIYATSLVLFYGVAFGAGWFMSRYLFPLGGFFVIGFAAIVSTRIARLSSTVGWVIGGVFVIAMAGVNVRTYQNGKSHPHFQVVEWATKNVPTSMWVGAVQTGTLGFFHDRTINLDGKVNIDAYEAIVGYRKGRYVADGPIEFLIDWAGMETWLQMPIIDANFRQLVRDPVKNLGVLERKDRRRFDKNLEPDRPLRDLLEARYLAALETRGLAPNVRIEVELGLARLARIDGNLSRAIEHATSAAAWDESESTALMRAFAERERGDAERVLGQRAAAASSYVRALALVAHTAAQNTAVSALRSDLHHGLAEVHRLEGRTAEATAALTRAAAADRTPRERTTTTLALGDLYRDSGDGTNAQAQYERALAERSTDVPRDRSLAASRLGRLLANTDAGRASTLIDEAIALRESIAPLDGIPESPISETLELGRVVLTSSVTSSASANP